MSTDTVDGGTAPEPSRESSLTSADLKARAAIAKCQAGELLTAKDMAAIWRLSISRFSHLNTQHAYDAFKVHPAIGPRCFSGVLVCRYLNGETVTREPVPALLFGRKRGAR